MKGRFLIMPLLMIGLLFAAGCEWREVEPAVTVKPETPPPIVQQPEEEVPAEEVPEEAVEEEYTFLSYTDYSGVYASISRAIAALATGTGPIAMPEQAPAADMGGADYSSTNVQVEGVAEADNVLTDGQHIYALSRDDRTELVVYQASGAASIELARISLLQDMGEDAYGYVNGMYLCDNTLVILRDVYQYNQENGNNNHSEAMLYDISNPAAPELLTVFGQDGFYVGSRVMDDTLYLVSSYGLYEVMPVFQTNPVTFVPSVYSGGSRTALPADKIGIPEQPENAYTVVTVLDVKQRMRRDQAAVLSACNTVYLSADGLYLAGSNYVDTITATYPEEVYTVETHESYRETHVIRYDIAGRRLEDGNGCSFNGQLLNQFALDTYEGNLRVAVTTHNEKYAIYTDEKRGFQNYKWEESKIAASLYVFDEDMQQIGALENFVENETVYSVRFFGALGYVCTYEIIDPLFAMDLSDPTQPMLLSALKISGFSTYLHPYQDGLLLGLGLEVDENTGWTSTLKLVMFNTTDPKKVSAAHSLVLPEDAWSQALYDHHALLVDVEKNLIGFPVLNSYLLYSYDTEDGFGMQRRIALPEDGWDISSRSLYIGEYLYIVSQSGLRVLDLSALQQVLSLPAATRS